MPRALVVALTFFLLTGCARLPFWPITPEGPVPVLEKVPEDAQPFTLATWNVNMIDADQATIAEQLAAFEEVDLWVLQEAGGRRSGEVFAQAAGVGEPGTFAWVRGTTGSDIPLMTLYDADRFELLEWEELHEVNFTGTVRAPLVLHLYDKVTGVEFLLVNNHLYRTQEDDRDRQATLLNQWAQRQTLPLISGGDFNFDYDVPDGPSASDRGFDNLTANDVWNWVEPETLVPTQCSKTLPCRYDEILDFIFVGGPAQEWSAVSRIVVRPGDFPDTNMHSDHRPVMATILPE